MRKFIVSVAVLVAILNLWGPLHAQEVAAPLPVNTPVPGILKAENTVDTYTFMVPPQNLMGLMVLSASIETSPEFSVTQTDIDLQVTSERWPSIATWICFTPGTYRMSLRYSGTADHQSYSVLLTNGCDMVQAQQILTADPATSSVLAMMGSDTAEVVGNNGTLTATPVSTLDASAQPTNSTQSDCAIVVQPGADVNADINALQTSVPCFVETTVPIVIDTLSPVISTLESPLSTVPVVATLVPTLIPPIVPTLVPLLPTLVPPLPTTPPIEPTLVPPLPTTPPIEPTLVPTLGLP